jgi:hypothetical protein
LLEDKFVDSYEEEGIFAGEFFKNNLRRVAELLMSVVYNKQPQFVKVEQLAPLISILQHIAYDKIIGVPESVLRNAQLYTHHLLVLQNLESVRTIFEDGHSSATMGNFYQNIYKSAFSFRTTRLASRYGLKLENYELPHYALQCVIEQKEGELDRYDSKPTAEWLVLALVYFVLAVKADLYKQKPVLSKILEKYHGLREVEPQREINGDELCHFYNGVMLPLLGKLEETEVERLVDEIRTDMDISAHFIVSPIQNENNTVLDNIVFSSSWEQ